MSERATEGEEKEQKEEQEEKAALRIHEGSRRAVQGKSCVFVYTCVHVCARVFVCTRGQNHTHNRYMTRDVLTFGKSIIYLRNEVINRLIK